jgi:hypothetical protein
MPIACLCLSAHARASRPSSVMAGHSRPKDGVLSPAYLPAIYAFFHSRQDVDARHKAGHDAPRGRGDERKLSQRFTCQTAKRNHPYSLSRPRADLSPSRFLTLGKARGMARQVTQPLFLMCPHSLSEIRGAARRAIRTGLRTSGSICGRFSYGTGPRFSWSPQNRDGLRQPAPGGRPLLAARRSPDAARVVLARHARGRRVPTPPSDASR